MSGNRSWGTRKPNHGNGPPSSGTGGGGQASSSTGKLLDRKPLFDRCQRDGCHHLVTMHDEGGCALAECSCHEAVGATRQAAGVPAMLAVVPAVEVHALELVNNSGVPLYLTTSYDNTTGVLTLTAGVLS